MRPEGFFNQLNCRLEILATTILLCPYKLAYQKYCREAYFIIMTNSDSKHPSSRSFDLELFFNLSPDLLCVAGYDGYFKKINPMVSKTLGFSEDELYSRPIDSFVHPEDRQITAKKRADIIDDHALLNFENRYVTKSGEVVWLAWTSMPVKSEQVVFAIAKNITSKRNLEDDRNILLTNLTKINNDLRQLTYAASHDLRLPVSNLLSVFNLLEIDKVNDLETREFIGLLRSSTESLKETLNNYVDILNGKNVLIDQAEEVSVSDCLAAAMLTLRSLILQSGTKISTDFSGFEKVNFNRSFLESIFLNLVTNSIKYAKPQNNPVISVRTQLYNGMKQLVFADEGQGFDMDEVKDKIFGFSQRFTTQKDSKGIGLYLVHNYVESSGGKITVESSKDQGARFIISFKK